MKYPDIVSKGLETNFVKYSEMIQKGDIGEPNEKFYCDLIAQVILFQQCPDFAHTHRSNPWFDTVFPVSPLPETAPDKSPATLPVYLQQNKESPLPKPLGACPKTLC